MGVAGGISAYCSQSYPLTAGRFLIVDLVVGGIGSTIPPDIDLVVCWGGDSGESNRSGSCLLVCGKGCGWS